MPLIVRSHNYVAGALIIAAQNNTNEITLYNLVNGNLNDDNISSLTETKVTFNVTTGHRHNGTDSRKIDNTGAGFLLRCETTGTDHAIIGRSSSAGAHGGIAGIGETATSYGGFFDHESSSGTSLFVTNQANGSGLYVENKAAVASNHASVFKSQSTAANTAAIAITTVTSNNFGLLVDNVAGTSIRISQGPSTTAGSRGIHIVDSGSVSSVECMVIEKTSSSNANACLRIEQNSATVWGLEVNARNDAVRIRNDTNSETSVQILNIGADATGVVPATSGWIGIFGTGVDNTTTEPIMKVLGKLSQAGTLVVFEQSNGAADGPTGGAGTDEWVLKVVGTGGANNNALYVDGYSLFDGNMHTTGAASAAIKAFVIDHPVFPSTKSLRHISVESPQMKNFYDGIVELKPSGAAVVLLPDYFLALNEDFRYQLTVIGKFISSATIAREIDSSGSFEILGDPGAKVCWQVTGIRKDRWALANPMLVEERKKEPGYIHPEVWQ